MRHSVCGVAVSLVFAGCATVVFDVPGGLEAVGAVSLFYTCVSDTGFGAVK